LIESYFSFSLVDEDIFNERFQMKTADIKRIFTIDESSFENYLDYERYEDGFFWMKDRVFFMLEITGGIFYYSEPQDLLAFYRKLRTVLNSVPEEADASYQSLFLPYRDIDFEPPKAVSSNELVKDIYSQIVDHVKNSPKTGYFDEASKLRDMRNFLIVSFPLKDTSILSKVEDAIDQRSMRLGSSQEETFQLWKRSFTTALQTLGAESNEVGANDFLYLMFTLLNQDFDPLKLKYLQDVPLRRQLLYNIIQTDHHEIAYQKSRWAMGYLSGLERVKPGFLVELMTLRRPFFISVNLTRTSPIKFQSVLRARKQAAFSKIHADGYNRVLVDATDQTPYTAEVYLGVLVNHYNETEQVKAELADFFSEYRWTFEFETIVAPDIFRSSLPGHANKKLKHEVFMFADHALCFLNFRNFRRKFSNQGVILVNEDLSPKMVSIFDSQAYGTLISGASGSGKTFFAQYMVLCSLAQGHKVIVLDPKGDYEALCRVLNGSYTKIGLTDDCQGLECFPRMTFQELQANKDIMAMSLGFLTRMISLGSSESNISAQGLSVLQKAFVSVYENSDTPDLLIYHEALLNYAEINTNELAREFAAALELFLPQGTYGGLISTDPTDLSSDLSVFDLGPIKEHVELLQLSNFGLMTRISELVMNSSGKKDLFIDEAHYLIRDKLSVAFIGSAVRVWRSLDGAITLITQQLTDLLENKEVGRGIFQTLNNFFLLRQSAAAIDLGQSYVGYNDIERESLKNLRTERGRYSFLAYYSRSMASDGEPCFGRFYFAPPRGLYWLLTSVPEERDLRESKRLQFESQGYDPMTATTLAIREILDDESARAAVVEVEDDLFSSADFSDEDLDIADVDDA
jgi:hypothetical protein